MTSFPRPYVVTVEITIPNKFPWEETLGVDAYELSEALMSASVRLAFIHGEKVKLRVKDVQPKPFDLDSLLASTLADLKQRVK
jgi:hypothetical protein